MTKVEEARKALLAVVWDDSQPGWALRVSDGLDAFAAAVREEALASPVKGSCYDCGGTGCESCDQTGDAGTQVLKLKNEPHFLRQPREPSPELAEAERQLRMRADCRPGEVTGAVWARAIAAEIDRLRGEVARLGDEKQEYANAVAKKLHMRMEDTLREVKLVEHQAATIARLEAERDDKLAACARAWEEGRVARQNDLGAADVTPNPYKRNVR